MDWKIPALRFKHLIEVKDRLGIDLTDIEQVAELDSILTLGPVIAQLSEVSKEDFEDNFHGDQIQEASDQLMEKLSDFFTSEKSSLLKTMREAQRAVYRQMSGGSPGGSLQDG